MTTFDQLHDSFDINRIEKSRQENTKRVALVIISFLGPLLVFFGRIVKLNHYKHLEKEIDVLEGSFAIEFETASEFERMDMYATIKHTLEQIEEVYKNVYLHTPKYGLFSYLTRRKIRVIIKRFKDIEEEYYSKIYPDNPDINDPEFLKEIMQAHENQTI